jgi:hypothetical protein
MMEKEIESLPRHLFVSAALGGLTWRNLPFQGTATVLGLPARIRLDSDD